MKFEQIYKNIIQQVFLLPGFMFGISGEQLTMRLRHRAFSTILRQVITLIVACSQKDQRGEV